MSILVEIDALGLDKIKTLKRKTVFAEMELRALFNEYNTFKDETKKQHYVSQAALRLKNKFEKLMYSVQIFGEIFPDPKKLKGYPKPVQDAIMEVVRYLGKLMEGRAKEIFEACSLDALEQTYKDLGKVIEKKRKAQENK